MRLRRIGDDFLDGCELDFTVDPTSDADAAKLAASFDHSFDPDPAAARAAAAATFGRDLSIARRLRASGLEVVEVEGWRSRGDAVLTPEGFVDHHTAGAPTGASPSLNICINGRADLSGPLCNIFLARDRRFHVVASGRANHAGSGAWRGASGNSKFHGCEVEHTGTKPLPNDLVELLAIANAALAKGRYDQSMVCQHHEYSSAGKIDIATNFHGDGDPAPSSIKFRTMVARRLAELDDVVVSRIVFPTSRRAFDGSWKRRRVDLPTSRVDEWLANHPAVLERRGRGSGVTVTPTKFKEVQ